MQSSNEKLNKASAAGLPGVPDTSSSESWYTEVVFKGIVLNEANRKPVDHATVRLIAYSSLSGVMEKTTAPDGSFEVVAPPSYRYGIQVVAEGFESYRDDSFVITRPYYDIRILLSPSLSLRGRVVDNLAAGVPDAIVQLNQGYDRPTVIDTVISDQQGVFTFSDVARPGRYFIETHHPGFDSTGMVAVTIPAESAVVVQMRPARTSETLSGIVTDSSHLPLPGAKIYLFDTNDFRPLSFVQSDKKGQYRIARMREGSYLVRCVAEGFVDSTNSRAMISISSNKETILDFSLDPGPQIRGTVVNQKGELVADAEVTYVIQDQKGNRMPFQPVNPGPGRMSTTGSLPMTQRGNVRRTSVAVTSTDADGRFQILNASDAQYQLTVTHRDYQILVTRLRPSNQLQTLVLEAGLSLRGTISDNRGSAVERFTLTFQSTTGKSERNYTFTSTDGHFEVHGLAQDVYQVSLQAQGRGRFSGTLDLQASMEVFIMLDASGRGGRGQAPLTFLKK
ncbi:MAG: carboxypeptidase-like regulatory domain-containing protein [Acidobacteriia bacterium]|nr:carboxypeptidase-like regulatory domain-containing protein [Terriglobia bacterium]